MKLIGSSGTDRYIVEISHEELSLCMGTETPKFDYKEEFPICPVYKKLKSTDFDELTRVTSLLVNEANQHQEKLNKVVKLVNEISTLISFEPSTKSPGQRKILIEETKKTYQIT